MVAQGGRSQRGAAAVKRRQRSINGTAPPPGRDAPQLLGEKAGSRQGNATHGGRLRFSTLQAPEELKSSPPAPTNALTPTHDFRPTLERLAQLSRNHLLYFRLEVGRLMLEEFFQGDAEAYRSHSPHKDHRFSDFLAAHREDIRELGLGESVLRQCIVARITVSTLPPGTIEKLVFTHVVELARVDDDATRRLFGLDQE